MEVVTFRASRRQIRNLVLFTLALSAVAAAIFLIDFTAGIALPDRVFAWGLGAAICAPFAGWVTFRYSRAVTECGPYAIRSRGLGRSWSCDWKYVADIAIRASASRGRTTYTVVVRTTAGDRLRLGMPVKGGVMPDPDFADRVRQIRAYWHSAAGQDQDPADAPLPADTGRAPDRYRVAPVVRGCLTVVFLGAIAVVPFTLRADGPALLARLGHGQRGTFTAAAHACDANCYWVGEFRPAGSSASRAAVPIAPGAVIGQAGQRVPAVYLGDGNLVYPADGGPGWIPLALLLVIIAGCLPFATFWLSRRLRGRRPRMLAYQPPAAGQPASGRTITSTRVAIIAGAGIVALTVAGAAIAYWSQDVPVSASPTTTACAEYFAWASAQSEAGTSDDSPALLAAAAQAATGQLQLDLSQLQSAVAAIEGAGSVDGVQVGSLTVLSDMTLADQACK